MDKKDLDKFYTKKSVANFCHSEFLTVLNSMKIDDPLYLEPSAGGGAFLEAITTVNKIGFDIAPENHSVHRADFLNEDLTHLIAQVKGDRPCVVLGNPPFGRKSSMAIEFLNTAFKYSNVIGFIVPKQFRKWSVQSQIHADAKLILDLDLQEDAFEFLGKSYSVKCCFQVWTIDANVPIDLRIKSKPTTEHSDFCMYQYNRTDIALKYFTYDWDFAVVRQGYDDYTFKAYNAAECSKKKHWAFFKAKSATALNNLLLIDFAKLAGKNTSVPGFGKADVVLEYNRLFGVSNSHSA